MVRSECRLTRLRLEDTTDASVHVALLLKGEKDDARHGDE